MKLEIQNLRAAIEGKEILKGIDLNLETGETHALMGPNGSGKSTPANVLLGHPNYEVIEGKVLLDGVDILKKPPTNGRGWACFSLFNILWKSAESRSVSF